MSDIFKFVKSYVTAKEVAIHYGFRPNHSDLICCPFHNDKHPSMKVDRRFYCFSCGAQGDAIDFVSRYFGIGLKEAAEKILSDFGIALMSESVINPKENIPIAQYQEKQLELSEVIRRLLRCKDRITSKMQELAPVSMDEEWANAFVDEIDANMRVTYLVDGLLFGAKDECIEFYDFYKEEIEELVREIEVSERQNHRKVRSK